MYAGNALRERPQRTPGMHSGNVHNVQRHPRSPPHCCVWPMRVSLKTCASVWWVVCHRPAGAHLLPRAAWRPAGVHRVLVRVGKGLGIWVTRLLLLLPPPRA